MICYCCFYSDVCFFLRYAVKSISDPNKMKQTDVSSWPLAPGMAPVYKRANSVEKIWYLDPRGFVRENRLAHIIPEANTGLDAQLNAIMRFAIYLAIFVALYRRSLMPALTIVLTAAVITFAIHRSEWQSAQVDRERMANLDVEIDPATRRLCTKPTADNPYMNFLLSDYSKFPERPSACDITRKTVRDKADDLANHNLYQDSDDIYGRRVSSSWQFVTNGSTQAMTDQSEFARWLYQPAPGGRGTCREGDGAACASKVFSMYPGI